MSATTARLAIGFAAGALSHLLFQGAYGSLLHAAQLLPAWPWSLMPVPPFGVPQTLSLAFWAGLWGLAFGLVEPRLTPRFGRWLAALPVAALALLTHWFVAQPLKGFGLGGGFEAMRVAIEIGFTAVFGLGIAAVFQGGALLLRRPARAARAFP
jgi:hypothetical protein